MTRNSRLGKGFSTQHKGQVFLRLLNSFLCHEYWSVYFHFISSSNLIHTKNVFLWLGHGKLSKLEQFGTLCTAVYLELCIGPLMHLTMLSSNFSTSNQQSVLNGSLFPPWTDPSSFLLFLSLTLAHFLSLTLFCSVSEPVLSFCLAFSYPNFTSLLLPSLFSCTLIHKCKQTHRVTSAGPQTAGLASQRAQAEPLLYAL